MNIRNLYDLTDYDTTILIDALAALGEIDPSANTEGIGTKLLAPIQCIVDDNIDPEEPTITITVALNDADEFCNQVDSVDDACQDANVDPAVFDDTAFTYIFHMEGVIQEAMDAYNLAHPEQEPVNVN
jgi:hypothetical protein